MKVLIVIPSRYGSTRFPAKPLAKIGGVTLLERTARIAQNVAAAHADVDCVVATDHPEIESHAHSIGVDVVVTNPELASGTDRALAAARQSACTPDYVINLQGDAPFTDPAHIEALIAGTQKNDVDVLTPVIRLDWAALDTIRDQKMREPFSGTSCIRLENGRALWFSKQIIPAIRGEAALRETGPLSPVFRHLGLYCYGFAALERFSALPVGHYEGLEGLEQLRFLENGMSIGTVVVEGGPFAMWGIDTPEDRDFAEALIAREGDPHDANSGR